MRRTFVVILIIISSLKLSLSQCREYIKTIAPASLAPYVIDGNFFAPIVYEGDEVVLHRTFLAGHRYKVVVLGMNFLQKYITIKDENGIILFQNFTKRRHRELNCSFADYQGDSIPCLGSTYFEFKPDHSFNGEIIVKIERKAKRKKDRLRGCLGIVVGFLPKNYGSQDSTDVETSSQEE